MVHLFVSKLYHAAVQQRPEEAVQPTEEVVPGQVLIECWVEVGSTSSEGHKEAIAAVVEVGKLMEPLGVVLVPLPDPLAIRDGRHS